MFFYENAATKRFCHGGGGVVRRGKKYNSCFSAQSAEISVFLENVLRMVKICYFVKLVLFVI
jgi:hypothetical protein